MIKIKKEHYPAVAELLTDCFLEDQLVVKQVKDIENAEEFLKKLFLIQMPVLNMTSEISSMDESINSVIVGYEKKKYKPLLLLPLSIFGQLTLTRSIKSSDLQQYVQNCKEAFKAVDLKWQKEFIKGNYYNLKVIAIAKSCRGKGIFREMLTPIIDYCKLKNIPISLETNTVENIPIYQHFGFELVKTIPEKDTDFCQYCFIRKPSVI